MQVLLVSGLLYLLIIALALWFRPALMFSENGTWKEFGIGRNSDRYTWLPFWLFAIASALMSYIIVFAISSAASSPVVQQSIPASNRRLRVSARAAAEPRELLPGYYMLNTPPINNQGVPRYVYIGDQPPA